MKKQSLSVALAVYNEKRHLEACLESVKDIADEIVIVDGGSTDGTVEIAKAYATTFIQTDNPPMFHKNKQKALDASTGFWILQLDADEVIPNELAEEIISVITNDTKHNGYYIPRKNNFWGHWMKKTGVYPDYAIRLIRKGKGTFPCKSVHEIIAIDGSVGYLKQPMLHYSYETMDDYWRKARSYTDLTAKDMQDNHTKPSIGNFCRYILIRPLQTFFTLFIRNKGFVDGIYGFLFSLFSATHYPVAYMKCLKK